MSSLFNLPAISKVFLYSEPIRMSCSFPGLTKIVEKDLKSSLQAGNLYLFSNKAKTYVKIIFWAKNGPCIIAKKVLRGEFELKLGGDTLSISGLKSVLEKNNSVIKPKKAKKPDVEISETKEPIRLGRMKGI